MRESAKKLQQTSPDLLSDTILIFLPSVSRGSIRIDMNNQPILKLTINQADVNKIYLEIGQKFMDILFATGMEMISGQIRNLP
jgi:hypothetical protein